MKRVLCLIAVISVCFITAYASESILEEQKTTYGLYDVARAGNINADTTLDDGLAALLSRAWGEVRGILTNGLRCVLTVLLISVLFNLLEAFYNGFPPKYLSIAAALAVIGSTSGNIISMFRLGQATIEEINAFSKVLMSSLITAGVACGTPLSASAQYSATILFSDMLMSVITNILFPLIYLFLITITADAAFENQTIGRIAAFIKWAVTGSLKLFLMLFVGYLTTTGLISATSDSVGLKTAQFAINGVVPVVGGILADAGETVMAGALVVKNALGVVGILGLFSLALTPFLTFGINCLLFKVASALTAPVCNSKLATLMEQIGGGIGIVFAMTCTSLILVFISIVSGMFVIGFV